LIACGETQHDGARSGVDIFFHTIDHFVPGPGNAQHCIGYRLERSVVILGEKYLTFQDRILPALSRSGAADQSRDVVLHDRLPALVLHPLTVAHNAAGARRAVDYYGSIGSSKAALEALCRQMAVEWAKDGIHVNVVAPGLLQTDTLAALPDAERRMQHEVNTSPLGRLVTLEEVAQVVRFLCSGASAGIVGQTIRIDGGKAISSFAP